METYLVFKDPVITTNVHKILIDFYIWLFSSHVQSLDAFFETGIPILDNLEKPTINLEH